MTQTDLEEISVVSGIDEEALLELDPKSADAQPASIVYTYHPTRWPFVNNILGIVDTMSKGRAGQIQRFVSFLFVGGLASVVNLIVLYIVDAHSLQSINGDVRHVIAFLLASEISILVNFSLNDYFTFRYLPGRARSWNARCVRFHMTSISGILLTLLINFSLTYKLHVPFVLAQAIAILIVLFYNFAVHHLFTYRHIKTVAAE